MQKEQQKELIQVYQEIKLLKNPEKKKTQLNKIRKDLINLAMENKE